MCLNGVKMAGGLFQGKIVYITYFNGIQCFLWFSAVKMINDMTEKRKVDDSDEIYIGK